MSVIPELVSAGPGRHGSTVVDGVPIAWEAWEPADPSVTWVVLVHGTSAHTAWWHHTVPWLSDGYAVVAVDLSGHGDSGRRGSYSLACWSTEVLAVVDDVCGGAAVLVGHSIGGLVAAGAAAAAPDAVGALVLVDCLVEEPVGEERVRPVLRQDVRYDTEHAALARYRLMPPQPVPDDRTLDYVARRSLRPDGDGWVWKVDPGIFGALDAPSLTAALGALRCPTSVVRGELSPLVPADAAARLARRLDADVVQYDVPDSYHHVMIDQGPAFGRLLRRALDDLVTTAPARADQPDPHPPTDEESP